MRPPNYTLLMIWIPVLLLAVVVGYLKRENLHVLYETRYWAIAAMVYYNNLFVAVVKGLAFFFSHIGLGICHDLWADVEPHPRTSSGSPQPTDWRNGTHTRSVLFNFYIHLSLSFSLSQGYFSGTSQYQFVAETYIVALLCILANTTQHSILALYIIICLSEKP